MGYNKKMNDKDLEKLLKALANKRRLMIIRAVKKGELSVGEIADKIHLSFKSTSRHLGLLAAADLVEREQRNTQVFYRLSSALPSPARHVISCI